MAGAEIGGDSSVQWTVVANHVRLKNRPPESGSDGIGGWRQFGIDETDDGAKVGFFISLKMPRDANDAETFVTTLCQACDAARVKQRTPGAKIQFILPIEKESTDQILIDWQSTALTAAVTHPRQMFNEWIKKQYAAVIAEEGKGPKTP
jgi:hypothetical protein